MTVQVRNLLLQNYAKGSWRFTLDANKEEERKRKRSFMIPALSLYCGGEYIHFIDTNGAEIAPKIQVSTSMPEFPVSRSTAGYGWKTDVFAFIHRSFTDTSDAKMATTSVRPTDSSHTYAVIVPWWGWDSRLVIDLDRQAVLQPGQYNPTNLVQVYRSMVKKGVEAMAARCSTRSLDYPQSSERYVSGLSLIHHAGMLQMNELEESLRTLKALSTLEDDDCDDGKDDDDDHDEDDDKFKNHDDGDKIKNHDDDDVDDEDSLIHAHRDDTMLVRRYATSALHKLGFDEERELRDAAADGDTVRMKELIQQGVDVNWGNHDIGYDTEVDQPALHYAVQAGHVDAVLALLKHSDIDVNSTDRESRTALFKVANEEVLDVLMKDPRVDINWTTHGTESKTALSTFCGTGDKVLVEKLLSGGVDLTDDSNESIWCANLGARDNRGGIHSACAAGRSDIVLLMLNAGCNVNETWSCWYKTPLSVAVGHGHTEVIKTLLECDDVDLNDVHPRPQSRLPPLCTACREGYEEIVTLLLGCSGNMADTIIGSALCKAVECEHHNIVKLLLADARITTNFLVSACSVAASKGSEQALSQLLDHELATPDCIAAALLKASGDRNMDVCNFLLSHGKLDPEISIYPALAACCEKNVLEFVELFLGNVDGKSWEGIGAAVHGAARDDHTKLLALLLSHGGTTDYTDDSGRAALSFQSQFGSREGTRLLLEQGADPNAVDNDGWAPLHYASKAGDSFVVTMLLDQGGNSDQKTNDRMTPLDVAREEKQLDVLRLLVLKTTKEVN